MRALLLTLAGALAVASCGKLDTVGGHYPSMKLYQPAGGGYHIHYADPPWMLPDPRPTTARWRPCSWSRASTWGPTSP